MVAPPVIEHRGIDIPTVFQAIIDTSITIEIALLSAWLYDKVKVAKAHTKLEINRVEVFLEEGEIRRVIAEQIKEEVP